MNDFAENYQSGYKATMLQCWLAQLSQHSQRLCPDLSGDGMNLL